MYWRWFRSPPVSLLDTALLADALETVAPQVTVLTAQLAPTLVATVVTPLLARWVALCWNLPASEQHHHSRPFGLLHHSLEVATHALTAFTHSSAWWRNVPDPATRVVYG